MLILGSSSPRRADLLKILTSNFRILKPDFDESLIKASPNEYPLLEAKNKYLSIKNSVKPQDFIICCDTVVVLDNNIFGKPKDKNEAFLMLKKLSNNTHEVISGYVLGTSEKILSQKTVTTKVTFNKLTDEQIKKYIKEEYVLDKAGSYAIQDDEKYHLINKIEGSYYNVVGFPLEEIRNDLLFFKVI